MQQRAIELTADGHPDLPAKLDNLGELGHLCYTRTGDLDELEKAVAQQQRAVNDTLDDHPHKPTRLILLGDAISVYLRIQRTEKTFSNALSGTSFWISLFTYSQSATGRVTPYSISRV